MKKEYNLREFALWILPSSWLSRVRTRLRADVIYVHHRSPPEPTTASAEIDTPKYTRIFPGPPKNRPNLSLLYPQICGQGAYSSCIQVRDLAAQIAARSLPSIYDYCL